MGGKVDERAARRRRRHQPTPRRSRSPTAGGLFVKTNAREPEGMFAAEARGLAWLAEARALRVPEVIAHGPGFLALELIVRGRAAGA